MMSTRILRLLAIASAVNATIGAAVADETTRTAVTRQWSSEHAAQNGRHRKKDADDPAAIAKLIEDINAAARKNKQRMLSLIVINTDVAASTLEQEKASHGLTFGDVYVAHSLSLATGKKVSAIFAQHKSGKSWAQIAKSHNVSLKGSSELIKEMQKG